MLRQAAAAEDRITPLLQLGEYIKIETIDYIGCPGFETPDEIGYIGFETFEEAQKFAEKLNARVVSFIRKEEGPWLIEEILDKPYDYLKVIYDEYFGYIFTKIFDEEYLIERLYAKHIDYVVNLHSGIVAKEGIDLLKEKYKSICEFAKKRYRELSDDQYLLIDKQTMYPEVCDRYTTSYYQEPYYYEVGVAIFDI